MTIFDGMFPLGLGTNRFQVRGADDEEGLERAAGLVAQALEAGVDFIDAAHTYSRGTALEILRRAFRRTEKRPGVTIKTRLSLDKTADDVRKRAEFCLDRMDLSKARYFYIWSLFSMEEFHRCMEPGGLYEGAQRLKDEGIVDHLCCSTHAPPDDIVRIIESGAFEAVTISYSVISALRLEKVLEAAQEHQVALAAMNPLGGGIIPRNQDYFAFTRNSEEQDTAQAALRFVKAHPEIQIILSGVSSQRELEANLEAVNRGTSEPDEARISRVAGQVRGLKNFCTGCRYCDGCPAGIPISEIMQSRNYLLFQPDDTTYQAKSRETLENIHLLSKLECDFSVLFEQAENPCIRCGKCERACTQRLPVMEAVADTYQRAAAAGFSVHARRQRLDTLLNGKAYHTVGFYPGGIYTQAVLQAYRTFFGEFPFSVELFDSSPAVWGSLDGGFRVHSPADIPKIKPDCIVVTSYKFKEEIYAEIKRYEADGIHVVKLHTDQDIPWLF